MKLMSGLRRTTALLPLVLIGATAPTLERYEIDRNHSRIGIGS